jgi:2,4-dienoyl-CoA reductase-like NADH-dependent reductase (Old Yellow Enzyme family)
VFRSDSANPCRRMTNVLAAPIEVGSLTVKNRVFLPAHSYGFPMTAKGTDAFAAYVGRRIAGGVGLAVVGEAEVAWPLGADAGSGGARIAGAKSEGLYEQLAALARPVAARVIEQLFHPGGQIWYEEQRSAFAPSAIPQERPWLLPFALDSSDIKGLIVAFGEAASRAVSCGIDGVEIKADQGKLHHQFLSRRYNRRGDGYGGDLVRRATFLFETLHEIRSRVPSSKIVGIRLPGSIVQSSERLIREAWGEDLSLSECIDTAAMLVEAKLVDYVSISGDTNSSVRGYWRGHGDETIPEATFRDVGKAFKQAIRLPIFLAGRIMSVRAAEELVSSGDCDLAGMARALIADAELLIKAGLVDGRTDSRPTRPCLSCNISCVGSTWYGGEVRCVYDPLSGREAHFSYKPKAKRAFAVCGAGPAGMEFARVAAELGSTVTIFERDLRIGGRLRDWAKLPSRKRIGDAINYWESTIAAQTRIKLLLNRPAPSLEALSAEFDCVVVASGGQEVLPAWSDANSRVQSWTVSAALNSPAHWQGRQVLLFEANRHSDPLGVALWLASHGATVQVACPFSDTALGLDPVSRASRLSDLDSLGIRIHTWTDVRPGMGGHLYLWNHAFDRYSDAQGVTDVVWCVNPIGDKKTRQEASDAGVFRIGDARATCGLEAATREAHDLAHRLLCDD